MGTTETKFAERTAAALRRGMTIHPLQDCSKKARLLKWPEKATTDPAQIALWGEMFPNANYGVVANDEFLILETDDRDTLEERLCAGVPDTYTVSARPGRFHFYFRQTSASNLAGNMQLAGVFEFRQHNAYVVGEGSIHPDTKGPYTCVNDADIATIPDWLVAALVRIKQTSDGKSLPSAPDPEPGLVVGEGGRHYFLARACGKKFDGEISEEDLLEYLNALDQEHCDPPKGEAHNQQLVAAAFKDWEPHKAGPAVICHRAELSPETKVESRGKAFDFVLGPLFGEKHGVFAKGSLHLLPGSSGNGKSTLGIQMLNVQRECGTFFGREGYGREFLIVWQDRTENELVRQLDNMGLLNDPPPYVVVNSDEVPAKALKRIYEEREVKPEILFVEGLDLWCEDASESKHVKPLARAVREIAVHYHLSIIGTIGQPKMKPKQGYASPRDRIIGSSVWGRLTDTILEVMVDDETDLREVQLIPRTGKRQKMTFEFKGGLLVPRTAPIDVVITPVPAQSKKDVVFSVLRNAPQATKEVLLAAFPDLADSTARNWVRMYWESLS